MASAEKILGIDLGTTRSLVAIASREGPRIIFNRQGDLATPSVVSFNEHGEVSVGSGAQRQGVLRPTNTIYSVKRLMGRRRNEITTEEQLLPYELVGEPNDLVRIRVASGIFTPSQVSAEILRRLKGDAEANLEQTVSKAVISVPAYFNDSQRQATRDAGRIAGLEVVRLVSEPTAVALSFGVHQRSAERIAVVDLGGGSFDVSVLEVADGVVRVLSTSGDTHLGGDDFDVLLVNHLADEFQRREDVDLRRDPQALYRLRESCERAKIELSSRSSAEVSVPHICMVSGSPKYLATTVTRQEFERLISPLVERCRTPIKMALGDAGLSPRNIHELIIVGECTRIPLLVSMLKSCFGNEIRIRERSDEAVASGAAIQGGILARQSVSVLLLDVTPFTLGIETRGRVMTPLVARNTTIPVEKRQVFTTVDDGRTAVTVKVFQGESERTNENRFVGQFDLDGIVPAPKGVPQIEVAMDVDVDGIAHVSATDLVTSAVRRMSVTGLTVGSEWSHDSSAQNPQTGELQATRDTSRDERWRMPALAKEEEVAKRSFIEILQDTRYLLVAIVILAIAVAFFAPIILEAVTTPRYFGPDVPTDDSGTPPTMPGQADADYYPSRTPYEYGGGSRREQAERFIERVRQGLERPSRLQERGSQGTDRAP